MYQQPATSPDLAPYRSKIQDPVAEDGKLYPLIIFFRVSGSTTGSAQQLLLSAAACARFVYYWHSVFSMYLQDPTPCQVIMVIHLGHRACCIITGSACHNLLVKGNKFWFFTSTLPCR